MAEHTRMKELHAEIKKMYELIEFNANEHRTLIAQMAEESKLRMDSFQSALETFMKTQQQPPFSHGSTSNSDNQQPPHTPHQVRKWNFDFPRFDGSNALEWIFGADKFFDYYNIPDMERIAIAAMHMDKGAVLWFQMTQRNMRFRS